MRGLCILGAALLAWAVATDAGAQEAPQTDSDTEIITTSYVLAARSLGVAQLEAEQVQQDNVVELGSALFQASIALSGNDAIGLIGINQSAGVMNNQANTTVIAGVEGDGDALALLDVNVAQSRSGNTVTSDAVGAVRISDSFNRTVGVAQVNQATGAANNQINALALVFGAQPDPGATILNDARLSQVNGDDETDEPSQAVGGAATIDGSFNAYRGVVQIGQTAGSLNQTANVIAVNVRTGGPQ